MKFLSSAIAVIFVLGVVLVMLANPDPAARNALCDVGVCFTSRHALFWNTLGYDTGLGVLISIAFYWLLVKVPEMRKRGQMRRHLKDSYRRFRFETTTQLMFAANQDRGVDYSKIEEILPMLPFRTFFKGVSSKVDGDRWHDVANGMTEASRDEIAVAITVLRNDIEYVLSNTSIDDPKSFELLHQLKRMSNIVVMNPYRASDDRNLLSFLWQIMAGWDWLEGYPAEDRVQRVIDRI